MQYIAFDSHLRYTLAVVEEDGGRNRRGQRIEHRPGAVSSYLSAFEPGTAVALEAVGSWYWIVDEIEAAGMTPKLVHPGKARARVGELNKTDRLDARGLNMLTRSGTLPTVWIAPGELRDRRELYRTRMFLKGETTRVKNRILSQFAKYNQSDVDATDRFGKKGRASLESRIASLPPHTQTVVSQLFGQLDSATAAITEIEAAMHESHDDTEAVRLLSSIPGVSFILAVVILSEIGDSARFGSAAHLAAYAGTTPRVRSSGGKTHMGHTPAAANQYLKWAFTEAANAVAVNQRHWPAKHVTRLYQRIRTRKGHKVAAGAVARHLAEATYHILTKGEAYREPRAHSSTDG